MAKFNITLIAILCAGCATQHAAWFRSGSTPLAFSQDQYQCLQETQASGNYIAAGAPLFVALEADAAQRRQKGMYNACMQAHGWSLVQVPNK